MRDELLRGTVDYLLANGIAGLSLRPLAKALGTSDRMLIYHFGSKDQLMTDAISAIADRLAVQLGGAVAATTAASADRFVKGCWKVFTDREQRSVIALLFEVDALAVRHGGAYAATATALGDLWIGLIQERLEHFGHDRVASSALAPGIAAELIGLILYALSTNTAEPTTSLQHLAARMTP